LTNEESEIAIKRDLFKVVENKMQEYKCEIRELIRKVAIKEENEGRISKCLERYVKSFRAFENKLSLMRNWLDKAFSKCANETLTKDRKFRRRSVTKDFANKRARGKNC